MSNLVVVAPNLGIARRVLFHLTLSPKICLEPPVHPVVIGHFLVENKRLPFIGSDAFQIGGDL